MHRISIFFLLILVCTVLFASCSTETNFPNDNSRFAFAEDNGGITLPDDFRALVVADSLGQARHLVIDEDGDIYVSLEQPTNGSGIVALRDTDGDGVADTTAYFGNYTGTGIALHSGYLYFGGNTEIVRYSMEGVDFVPTSEPEILVTGFQEQPGHAAKPLAFDGLGNMYVFVGPHSNSCQEENRVAGSPGMDPCPFLEYSGGIWIFDENKTGQVHPEDGELYATGIRSIVGLEWNPELNQLFGVQHGRDLLGAHWPEFYTDEESAELPAEEFFRIDEDDNFGWPYTYYDHFRGEKMLNPEYGGDGETLAPEGEYKNPILAFPGHWAPNDLHFYSGTQFPSDYIGGAFIAFHGSWNRKPLPQEGYKVVFVPFDGATPADGTYQTFADGFAGTKVLYSRSKAEHRPVGLAQGPDGSLYIVDSVQGKLWRVIYTGN